MKFCRAYSVHAQREREKEVCDRRSNDVSSASSSSSSSPLLSSPSPSVEREFLANDFFISPPSFPLEGPENSLPNEKSQSCDDQNISFLDCHAGLNVKFCGHAIHLQCLHSLILTLFKSDSASDAARNYFECPLCRTLCNTFVPWITPTHTLRPFCRRHDLTSASEDDVCSCLPNTPRAIGLPTELGKSVEHMARFQRMTFRCDDAVDDTASPLSLGTFMLSLSLSLSLSFSLSL